MTKDLRRFLTAIPTLVLVASSLVRAAGPSRERPAPKATTAVQAVLTEGDRLLGEKKPDEALAAAERALAAATNSRDTAGQAYARMLRARACEARNRPDDAITAWSESAGLWEKLGAGPERIEALCAQALSLIRSDPAGAASLVEQAVALTSKEKTRPLAAASSLDAAAEAARRAGLLDIAGQLASAGLAIREKLAPGSLDVAASLGNLGGVAYARGDRDTAQEYLERALAIRERLAPGSLDLAASLASLGLVIDSRGDIDTARDYYQRALVIREKLAPGSLDLARNLNSLGGIAREKSDLDTAQDFYERALAIREKLAPGSLDVASSLNNLGSVAYFRGDLEVAQDYYARALAIREKLAPGSLDVGGSLNNLGIVAAGRDDLDAARDYYQRALAIQEKFGPGSLEVAGTLNNLGIVADSRGDLDAARDYYQRALAIQEKLAPGSLEVAGTLNNLGNVANSQGDRDAAHDYYQRALAIQERFAPGSLEFAISLINIGNVMADQGDYDAARDYNQRALAIREKLAPDSLDVAESLDNLGAVAYNVGDLDAARDDHQRALTIQEKLAPGSLDVAATLQNLGNVAYNRGDLDTAKEHYQRALVIRQELSPDSLRAAGLLGALGMVLRQQGALATSEDQFARAWSIVREQRRAVVGDEAARAFGADRADVAVQLVRVRLAQGKTAPAFQALEEGRAQGLLALLSGRGLSGAGSDPDLWRRYLASEHTFQNASQMLAEAGTNDHEGALSTYTQARLEQDRLLGEIRRSLPGLEPRSFTFEEARRVLPRGSVFLAWMVGQEDSAVFVIPADPKQAIEAHTIALNETQLAERVGALRKLIDEGRNLRGVAPAESRRPAGVDSTLLAASRELFESLLPNEARGVVEKAERVIVSPDGPLWELPFAALVTNASRKPVWLGLKKKISYAPSLTILALERERARPAIAAPGEVLVVGNPVFARATSLGQAASERSSLAPKGVLPAPLPASGDEAREIAALYGALPLLGEAATEAAVRRKISGAAVVHLATHGYFHPSLAMSSGVLLTPPPVEPAVGETDNDGALQAWEFGRTLPLQADLVVLSACETGRGEKVRGEGLIGLTRAIQGAGARSVVATQWSVPDTSTASLMVTFHARLKDGLPKDEALRRALAETAAKPATRHPYYWAGFFITGDSDHPL
jgi:CHAT domain-containing protein/tetratricopeptide (TPR) repeat protein